MTLRTNNFPAINAFSPANDNANRKARRAYNAELNRLLAPEDMRVVYELDGVQYPEGLELISPAGVRKLARHFNTPRPHQFEAWMNAEVLPTISASH